MVSVQKLTDSVSVSPQIAVDDLDVLAKTGFVMVINNRPDGEEPGQPDHRTLAKAAQDAGLSYHYLPMTMAGLDKKMITDFADLVQSAGGPVLAYCRSGGRSAFLWALGADMPVADILDVTGRAGFDFSSQAPVFEQVRMLRKQG